jgi:hypothetical protein
MTGLSSGPTYFQLNPTTGEVKVIKSLKDDKAKLTTYNVSALGNIVKIFDM